MKLKLVGHSGQRESLKRLLKDNKLPSTILFAGASGIGKLTVARELSRSLFCGANPAPYGGCGECEMCRLFEVGNVADFHLIECSDKSNLGVDGIKDVLYTLNLKSYHGGARVIVLNDADALLTQSANALLKSLEEPRPNTWYILVTANPSRLPQTIISRSQVWFFNTLSHAEVLEVLKLKDNADLPPNLSLEDLAILSDGSPGNCTEIARYFGEWVTCKETLSAIFSGDIKVATQFAATLAKDKDSLRGKLRLLRIYARTRMLESPPHVKWATCLTNIITAERLIFDRNLAAGTVLLAVFLNLVSDDHLNSFTTLTNSVTLLKDMVV